MSCASFLAAAESLHATNPEQSQLLKRVLEEDAALQSSAASMLQTRDNHAKSARLMQGAVDVQGELLQRAASMQAAQLELAGTIERSRQALASADKGQASGRHVTVATLVEYAERVSYSNAAPSGHAAFSGAGRQLFYQGWGTPTPQQHMVAASRFANPADLVPEEDETSVSTAAEAIAPTFTAVVQPQVAPAAEGRTHVSLSLGESDDDDDF